MQTLCNLIRNESGASAVLFGLSLPPLMAFAAFALDLGSLYLAERRLQGISDAAAAAAVTAGGDRSKAAIVAEVIAESGARDVNVITIVDGEYLRDPEIHWDRRFDETSLYPNATRVLLSQDVPLFFGSFITGSSDTRVTAKATAARTDMAGFMLGTRVVDLPGTLADSLLSALAGTALDLTPDDIEVLGAQEIDVLDLAEQLGPLQEMEGETFGEIFEADTPLHTAVEAMAAASGDERLAAILTRIASRVGEDFVTLGDLIDLGPLRASDVNDGTSGVTVDAYSLLRNILQAAQGDSYDATLDTDIAGLASVDIRIAGGFSEERSPWLTIDTMGDVILRTSETRILVEAQTGSLAGLPTAVHLPIYSELASAEAQMTDIVCAAADPSEGVYVEVKPSIGTVAIADVDTEMFAEFSSPLWLKPATLVDAAIVEVDGYAELSIGGDLPQEMHFTPADVEARTVKTAGTQDAVEGSARSLAEDVELDLRTLGLGVNLGDYASIVGHAIEGVAPSLDVLLNQLNGLLGIKLGAADVTVDRLRCGRPTIVA